MSRQTVPVPWPQVSLLKRLILRSPITAFLIMAYCVFWITLLPAFFFDLARPLSAIGSVLGLALPALLVSSVTGGVVEVRKLLQRCLRWPTQVIWYIVTLFALPAATILMAVPFHDYPVLAALTANWPLLFSTFLPQVLLAFLTIQLWEEAAWIGFVQDRWQSQHHPLKATALVALAFAWIHLPTYFLGSAFTIDRILSVLIMMMPVTVFALFFRLLLAWVYNLSGKSVPLVALVHAVFNTVSSEHFARHFVPNSAAQWLPLAVVTIMATIILLGTRGRLGYKQASR